MDNHGVLLISRSLLFTEAVKQLLQAENIEVTATVQQIEDAWPLLRSRAMVNIIAELDDSSIDEGMIISQLCRQDNTQLVIFLSLESNRMIVHRRECVDNVTSGELILALQDIPQALMDDAMHPFHKENNLPE